MYGREVWYCPSTDPSTSLTANGRSPSTMEDHIPPDNPNDTNNEHTEQSPSSLDTLGDLIRAESMAQFPSADAYYEINPKHRTHQVDFTVTCGAAVAPNATLFLSQLLKELQLVDGNVFLSPHLRASGDYGPLESEDEIPTDDTQGVFVNQYLEGLTLVNSSMKGSVYIHCKSNFSFFKRNTNFKQWLMGSQKTFKIDLQRCDLVGSKRFTAGMFFHVVPRPDFEEVYCEIVAAALLEIAGSRTVPKFVIQTLRIFMRGNGTKVYNMVTNSKQNADTLSSMMQKLAPTPSADTTFIPNNVWMSLAPANKTKYVLGQTEYLLKTSAVKFTGIQDSRLMIIIPGPQDRRGAATFSRMSIREWMMNVKTLGGQSLFRKVFPSVNGEMLLMYSTEKKEEVLAWIKSALVEIASYSGLNPYEGDHEAAEAMFKSPRKVWKNLESRVNMSGPINFPTERAVYAEYDHPEVDTKKLREEKKRLKKNTRRSTPMSLV